MLNTNFTDPLEPLNQNSQEHLAIPMHSHGFPVAKTHHSISFENYSNGVWKFLNGKPASLWCSNTQVFTWGTFNSISVIFKWQKYRLAALFVTAPNWKTMWMHMIDGSESPTAWKSFNLRGRILMILVVKWPIKIQVHIDFLHYAKIIFIR